MSHSRHDTMYPYTVQQHYSTLKYSLQAIKISAYGITYSSTLLGGSLFDQIDFLGVDASLAILFASVLFLFFSTKQVPGTSRLTTNFSATPREFSQIFFICSVQTKIKQRGKSQISCSRLFFFHKSQLAEQKVLPCVPYKKYQRILQSNRLFFIFVLDTYRCEDCH